MDNPMVINARNSVGRRGHETTGEIRKLLSVLYFISNLCNLIK